MERVNGFFNRYGLFFSFLISFCAAILYSVLSVVRHMHFQSGAYDLGIFDQTLWQYAHFLYPFNTIKGEFILGDHLNLTLPLLAPLYWVWDDVRIILIFQAVWVSFSSIGIYLYLLKRKFTSLESLLLSCTYLLFYGIQFGLYFDFHPILLAVGLLAWLLYFWEKGSWKLFWLSIVVLLLTQENIGIALVGLSCIWFFERKRIKLSIGIGLLGLLSTAVSFSILHFLGHLQYVPHFATTIPGIIHSFYDVQDKRDVWLYTYASYAFLPIFSPGSVLAVVGDLSQYFTTGSAFSHMWSPFLHHRAILSIFLIAGLADVLGFIRSKKKILITPLVIFLFIWSLGVTYHFHFAITKLFHTSYYANETWMSDNYAVMQHIPHAASLAAQQSLVPHVAHRKEIYLIYPRQDHFAKVPLCVTNCWWLDFAGKPEYVFVDTHDNEWLTMTLADITDFRQAITNMRRVGVLVPYYSQGSAALYKVDYQKLARIQQ